VTQGGRALPSADHIVGDNEFGRYCVPASSRHRPAARAILEGRVWEPDTIAFMVANCGASDIVHAGTYFGDFLPALSRALAPGARLWAFEPSSENFACATETIALNGLTNVALTHAGLGARAGSLPLRIGDPGRPARGGSSRVDVSRTPGSTYEDVPIVTLDESVPADRTVSIVQLDVEYFEQQALAGGLGLIRRCLPIIILENLPADETWFAENILALGYRASDKVHRNTVFRSEPALGGIPAHEL